MNVVVFEVPLRIIRIVSADHDVSAIIGIDIHRLIGSPQIFRRTGEGIRKVTGDHASDHKIFIDLMT